MTTQIAQLSMPRTLDELREWVRLNLKLDLLGESQLLEVVEQVLARQRQLVEQSKQEAILALTEGFTAKMARLQTQLSEKDVTVSNVARYFEEVVADLTDKSHRDPKTKLLNFNWFMERLESYLAVEQRVRWCGVGVVDITSFKRYNDTFGHAVGDLIIERVARILSEQIRSDDFLAVSSDRRQTEPAICTPGSAATSIVFSSRSSPGASKPPTSPSVSARPSPPTTGRARTNGSLTILSASTSASSACGWGPSRSAVAWHDKSRPSSFSARTR